MKWTSGASLSCSLLVSSIGVANAIPIVNVVPTSASVTEGDTTSIDVLVSGLDNELIGAYDLTLAWDPSLLSLTNVTFDTFLGGPLDSIAGFDSASGSLGIFEISLSGLSNQLGLSQFRLFSLDFSTLEVGLAAISISGVTEILSNELGEEYQDWGIQNASLQIIAATLPPTSVPEPASLSLLLTGLAGTLVARRVRRSALPSKQDMNEACSG